MTGVGDGSFNAFVSYPAGDRVRAGRIGDINGDGSPDLVAANSDAATVSVPRNDGNGALLPRVTYPSGSTPKAIAFGDFDGSNGMDIAVANGQAAPGTVSILLADGFGGFAPPHSYTLSCDRPVGIVAARLDTDADLDLALVCSGRPVNGTWINPG